MKSALKKCPDGNRFVGLAEKFPKNKGGCVRRMSIEVGLSPDTVQTRQYAVAWVKTAKLDLAHHSGILPCSSLTGSG